MPDVRYDGHNPKQQAGPGCCQLILNGILCYFMYVYAFDNPDVANNGGVECYASSVDNLGTALELNGRRNVSKEMMTWFKFGFIINVAYLVVGVLQLIHFISELAFIGYIWMCIGIPMGCGSFAWFITGMIFRWNHTGKVCSGEYYDPQAVISEPDVYMWKSGKFMQIYFILCFCICALTCICGCCAGIILAGSQSH